MTRKHALKTERQRVKRAAMRKRLMYQEQTRREREKADRIRGTMKNMVEQSLRDAESLVQRQYARSSDANL